MELENLKSFDKIAQSLSGATQPSTEETYPDPAYAEEVSGPSEKDFAKAKYNRKSKGRKISKNSRSKYSHQAVVEVETINEETGSVFSDYGDDPLGYDQPALASLLMKRAEQFAPAKTHQDFVLHIERVSALMIALHGQTTTAGVMATIALSAQSYLKGSALSTLTAFVRTILKNEQQSDYDWIALLRGAQDHWDLVVKSASFKKISAIITVCTTMGILGNSGINITESGLSGLVKSTLAQHSISFDLVGAILSSVVHFFEKGCLFFRTGDWKSFFVDNQETLDLDNQYCEALKHFGHAKTGDLEEKEGINDDTYAASLDELEQKFKRAYQVLPQGQAKRAYYDRWNKVQSMANEFELKRSSGGLREAPFGICVFGPSSVGKSTVVQLLSVALMQAFDLGGPKNVAVLNGVDKYESTMRSSITTVIMDDVANTKADFVDESPTARIIRYANNTKDTAVMADVDMKGRVQIRPKLLFTTSNVKDLGASVYSNEPISIIRRMDLIVTVKVRPEFCLTTSNFASSMLDTSKIPRTDEVIQDIWLFTVERAVGQPRNKLGHRESDDVVFVPYVFEDKPTVDISIHDLIRLSCSLYARHQTNQKGLVKRCEELHSQLSICKTCYGTSGCSCEQPLEKQWFNVSDNALPGFESFPKGYLEDFLNAHFNSYMRWYLFLFPKGIIANRLIGLTLYGFPNEGLTLERANRSIWALLITCGYLGFAFNPFFAIIFFFFAILNFYFWFMRRAEAILSRYRRVTRLYAHFREREITHFQKAILGVSFCAFVYGICKLWNTTRNFDRQGNLAPTCEEDIQERNEEKSDWSRVRVSPLPARGVALTTTSEQLASIVADNLCHVVTAGGSSMNAFFVKSNLALIPGHMLDEVPGKNVKRNLLCTFTRYGDDQLRGTWCATLSRAYSVSIPGIDVRLIWVPNAPSFKDVTGYFLPEHLRSLEAHLYRRDSDGSMVPSKAYATLHKDSVEGTGYKYNLEYNTFLGLCGSVLIGLSKSNVILGIHTAGVTGAVKGRASAISQSQLETAEHTLREQLGVVIGASVGDFPETIYDKQILTDTSIHMKSPVRHLPLGTTIEAYGSCSGRSTIKSTVVETVISPHIAEVFGRPNIYGPPSFKGPDGKSPWYDFQRVLALIGTPNYGFSADLMIRSIQDYLDPLVGIMNDQPFWKKVSPLTRMQNVCGVDGARFINALPANTSVGFPLSGPKREYMTELEPNEELYPNQAAPKILDEIFWTEASAMKEKYLRGERCYPVFKACLKDEPTKLTKKKVRVFQSAPIAFQLIIREYFLPICNFLSSNPLISEIAVGINALGPEWSQLSKHISKYGSDYILAGDYANYDTTISAHLIYSSISVFVQLAKLMNYTEDDLTIMQACSSDIANYVCAFNGDLIQTLGSNASGINITVFVNGISNCLALRCAYFQLVRNPSPYRSRVALTTYGDDAKASVHSSVRDEYNHISVAQFLGQHGMVFTMPDKNSTPIPFLTDDDADFLKRKNNYIPELGYVVGSLDEDSIFKSLHSVLASSALSPREQAVMNADSAMREWFLHGREKYELRRAQMKIVMTRADLMHCCQFLAYDFDYWVADWLEKYNITPPMTPMSDSHDTYSKQTTCDLNDRLPVVLQRLSPHLDKSLGIVPANPPPLGNPYLGESVVQDNNGARSRKLIALLATVAALAQNLNIIINDNKQHEQSEQITTFMDGNPAWTYEVPTSMDSTMSTIDASTTDLGSFFQRPIRIAEINWEIGQTIFENFNPWKLFWENKRNINRITNYSLLRSRLHVAFKINGNSFLYGRLIASYIPMGSANPGFAPNDNMTQNRAGILEDIVEASQRPHIYLNPTDNSGGDMVLPYFYYKNYWRVVDSEWGEMGLMNVRTLNDLKHANGGTDNVTVSVYAWATDIEFGMPTMQDAGALVPQSEPEYEPQAKDEYSKGVISQPLSTVARIAGMLDRAPIIGAYAKATSLAAGTGAEIARMFGFSRPVQLAEIAPYKNNYVGNLVNTNVLDNSVKLSMDAKQELTVDSRTVGLDGTDELAITNIVTRESYLTQVTWNTSYPVDRSIFAMRMNPIMYDERAVAPLEFHFTPACFIGSLFRYWHGTMEVRLQFVCSTYHKGRVRITYDPVQNGESNAEDNLKLTTIVDLAQTKDVTIKVPWSAPTHWLQTTQFGANMPAPFNQDGTALPTSQGRDNGFLNVYVLNELTTPNSVVNNDIKMNVFFKMCDDAQFAAPTGDNVGQLTPFGVGGFPPQSEPPLGGSPDLDDNLDPEFEPFARFEPIIEEIEDEKFVPQSTPETEEPMDTLDDNAPVVQNSKEIGDIARLKQDFVDIYPGESVPSLRTVLKRYCYHTSYAPPNNTPGRIRLKTSMLPYFRGSPAGSLHVNTFGEPWTYAANTYINYILPAFAGWRGGVRWKALVDSTNSDNFTGDVTITRLTGKHPFSLSHSIALAGPQTPKDAARKGKSSYSGALNQFTQTTMNGMATNRVGLGATEAEIPFYSSLRFFPAKRQNLTTNTNFQDFYGMSASLTGTNTSMNYVNMYCATAEDFNLFFFTGTPVMYYVWDPDP